MNPDNFQVWRPLDVGSTFVMTVSGDDNFYNIIVVVDANGVQEAIWRHEDLQNNKGPQKRTIAANDICTFSVLLNVTQEPKEGDSVSVSAHIEKGGATDPNFDLEWDFSHVGNFPITIFAQNL
jgi:hypothetical protein